MNRRAFLASLAALPLGAPNVPLCRSSEPASLDVEIGSADSRCIWQIQVVPLPLIYTPKASNPNDWAIDWFKS